MARKQETVKSICDEMLFEIDQEWYIDRILAAHERELKEASKHSCEYATERHGCMVEDREIKRITELQKIIGQMDTNCNRLKERIALLEKALKSSCRWIKCHDIYHTSGVDILKEAKELLQDDGEFLFKENK